MEEIKGFLKDLGLNTKQIKLYLASLKYGPQPASVLAKHTNIVRPTAYHELYNLIELGVYSQKKEGQVTKFTALPPEALEYIIDSRLASAKKLKSQYNQLLPMFSTIKLKEVRTSDVNFYSGVKGLCRMLDDFMAEDESVLYISAHNSMDERIRDYVNDVYLPKSNTHTNKNKIIFNDGPKSREYQKVASNAYDEFIFINADEYKFNVTTAIYADKVAFWSYATDDLSGVIVRNKNVSDDMRKYFDILKKYFQSQS